ncbi:MAG TPA: DUF3618 domain-containing protein [Trebonia sp.]|jgi:hypothetical protein|nr:DUF3618 domain-containing protein [Trebonia sp.]
MGTGQTDDAQQLREEIERTREHLGATVEQLAAKVDVKSRAQASAAELAGRVKDAAAKAQQAVPGSARQAISRGASATRARWVPLAVPAGAAVLAVAAVAIWQRRKR